MAVRIEDLRLFTADEYLEIEERSLDKSEYYYGHILAMAGGSLRHNSISVNVSSELRSQLRDANCFVVSSDQRIAVDVENSYFYPDVTVICGKAEVLQNHGENLLNPTIVIEVMSPSNTSWHRSKKVEEYKRVQSIRAILLVEQSEPRVNVIAREDSTDSWHEWIVVGMAGAVELKQPACQLAMSEVYLGIEFNEE